MKYFAGIVALAAFSLAAGESTMTQAPLDDKINTWVEGTVTAVDAANLKLVVHGAKDQYATEYARMMHDIYNKTSKLSGADRDKKEADIRRSYAKDLAKAQSAKRDSESDFTVYLPSKDAHFLLYDESKYYGQEFKDQSFTERMDGKNAGLTDLQIGERVAIGYESGVVSNHLHAVIRNHSAQSTGSREPINTGFNNSNTNNSNNQAGTKPDNSAVNARDRHPNEPTADQQGENPGDRKITQDIRAALVKDGSLSTYAHNIKIITMNGQVTLKGPVKSEEEKQTVEKTARSVAGERVVNNLDVTK